MNQAKVKRTLRMTRIVLNLSGSLLLVVCATVFWLAVIRPEHQSRIHLDHQAQRFESMQRAASGVRRTESALQETLSSIRRTDAQLRDRIPQQPDEHKLLRALNEVADASGVQIVDYQRTGDSEQATYSTFGLDLHCQGDYAALCRFLDGISKIEQLVIVERLSIGSDMASAEHGVTLGLVLLYGLKSNDSIAGGVHDA